MRFSLSITVFTTYVYMWYLFSIWTNGAKSVIGNYSLSRLQTQDCSDWCRIYMQSDGWWKDWEILLWSRRTQMQNSIRRVGPWEDTKITFFIGKFSFYSLQQFTLIYLTLSTKSQLNLLHKQFKYDNNWHNTLC
jgi:hypothetical protein